MERTSEIKKIKTNEKIKYSPEQSAALGIIFNLPPKSIFNTIKHQELTINHPSDEWEETVFFDEELGERLFVAKKYQEYWFIAGLTYSCSRFCMSYNFLNPNTLYSEQVFAVSETEDMHTERTSITNHDSICVELTNKTTFLAIIKTKDLIT